MLNDAVGEQLCRIVMEYGVEVCQDSRRVEALLRDLSGEHRREIFVLVGAAREGIPAELLAAKGTVPAPVLGERLARLLEDNLGFGADAARWAVGTWASALDVVDLPAPTLAGGESVPEPAPEPPPEPAGKPAEEGGPEPSLLLGEWLASLQAGPESDLGWGLLGVLAAAAGPLTVPEVADLLGAPVRSLHQTMRLVKDLLLDHGKFDLSDPVWRPRLSEYVGRAEREEGLARLTDWCRKWIQTGDRLDDVPDYVIAHASTHLRDAEDAEALYGLIGNEWRCLSAARTGSPRAFMTDMKHASECAASASPAGRLQGLRATLALTTAGALASRVPPEALGVIASAGQHGRALDLAGFLSSWEKPDAYGWIALALHSKGLGPEADEAAAQAIAAADPYPGLLKLEDLAKSFRDHGPEAWAVRAAERILAILNSDRDDEARDYAAGKTAAGIFTRAGRLDEALQASEAITTEVYRDDALTDVAMALARAGRTRDAVSATRTMSENGRMHVMRELFRVIGEVTDIDGMLAAIDVADDPEVKDQARQEAAIALARTGQADPAVALAGGLVAEWRRDYAAKTILSSLVSAGQIDRAVELAGPAADDEERSEALTNIAESAAEAGLTSRALQVIALIPGETQQHRATQAVAGALARSGNVTEATDLVPDADSQNDQDQMLAKVTEELAKAGHLHHAVEVAETISADGTRAEALMQAADALTKAGHHFRSAAVAEQATAAARATKNISQQARALTAWAQALLLSARPEQAIPVAEQAIGAAEAASNQTVLAKALALWASALASSGRADQAAQAAERAIAAARGSEQWEVDRALADVASTLARSGPADWAITAAQALRHDMALQDVARELARRGLADDAMRAARALTHSWNRDPVLSDIADILARRGERTQALAAATAILETSEEGHRSVAAHDMGRAIERAALALAENRHTDDALAAAQAAGSPWKTRQILIKIACAVGRTGDLDRATTIASEITQVSSRADAFGQLAEALAEQGRATEAIRLAEKALEVALTSPSDPTEAEALAQLAVLLQAADNAPAGLALAELALSLAGPDPEAGGKTVVLAASVFAAAGDSARAVSLAQQALAAARTGVHADVKAAILADTAPVLACASDGDLAAEAARDALTVLRTKPENDFYRSDPVAATAISVLATQADVGEALDGLGLIHFSAAKAAALARIGAELAQREQRDRLLTLAHDRLVVDPLAGADRVAALTSIAAALVTVGEHDEAAALAEEAGSQTRELSQPDDRALAIPCLAQLLAHLGRTEEASAAVTEAEDLLAQVRSGQSSRATLITVQTLALLGQTSRGLSLARDARGVTQNDRAECLLAVAAALTSAGDKEQAAALVDEAFAPFHVIGYGQSRADFYRLLCELIPRHPGLFAAWLPGAGELSRLVAELAKVEAWWRP